MRKNLWRNKNIKIFMEAGLAVLLVAVIGIYGVFSGPKAKGEDAERHLLEMAEEENRSSREKVDENSKENTGSGGTESTDSGNQAEEAASGQYPIMGSSSVTVEQMVDYFNSSGEAYPAQQLAQGGADSIETFCQMYYEEAEAEGVRAEVAFAQTMKETGWLQYGGDASIEQFNFAGIGTTGGGVPGNSYPDVRTGIRAQIQHLKAYATEDALEQACVDDRYEYVVKGSAPYVEWLGQQENPQGTGWATAENYGASIVAMIQQLNEM